MTDHDGIGSQNDLRAQAAGPFEETTESETRDTGKGVDR